MATKTEDKTKKGKKKINIKLKQGKNLPKVQ